MVDTAVQLYCRPPVDFTIKQHITQGKTILEVEVPKGNKRPYKAKDEDGKWLSYFRHNDQNLLANRILLQVWRKEEKHSGVMVKFGEAENILMDYLQKNGSITLSKFRKIARISAYKAESILANHIIFKVLIMNASEKGLCYELNPADPREQIK
jgi:predicted HTH transcriptional regulator